MPEISNPLSKETNISTVHLYVIRPENRPEATLQVHTVDRYKVILLQNVPKTLHRALQNKCLYNYIRIIKCFSRASLISNQHFPLRAHFLNKLFNHH